MLCFVLCFVFTCLPFPFPSRPNQPLRQPHPRPISHRDRGLSQVLHADLHWLDLADRARYKLAVTVHQCLHNKAPKYLADCCVAVSDVAATALSWTCHVINAVHSAVAHFLSPDRSSGTRFQTNLDTTLKTVVLGSH